AAQGMRSNPGGPRNGWCEIRLRGSHDGAEGGNLRGDLPRRYAYTRSRFMADDGENRRGAACDPFGSAGGSRGAMGRSEILPPAYRKDSAAALSFASSCGTAGTSGRVRIGSG